MEMIPEVCLENGRVQVVREVERTLAHAGEKRWHPTTQILVTDGTRYALVDKYPKNLRKAELYGYEKPPRSIRLDVFGGHMQWEQLTACDRENGVSQETFDACALEEASEEMRLNGAPCVPEAERMRFIGMAELAEEREVCGVYVYRVEPGTEVAGQDDAALPGGGREQIPLRVWWLDEDTLERMYARQQTGLPVELDGQPAQLCSGLTAAWRTLKNLR